MDQQFIEVFIAWARSALADSVGIAVGIWCATEAASAWNRLDSRKTSVILALVFGVLGWFGGYWGKHLWFEAIILTCFAWWLASKFHNLMGRALSQAVINPASMIQEPPKPASLDEPSTTITTVTTTGAEAPEKR